MDIVIIGAGIGGLAAANALAREGHRITVLERRSHLKPAGAGIIMGANATRILAGIGVRLSGSAQELARTELRSARGAVLATMDYRALPPSYGSVFGITRTRLHELLVDALPSQVEILLSTQPISIDESAARPIVHCMDRDFSADLVVGADGLHSSVREMIITPTSRPALRAAHQTCWRGIVKASVGEVASEAWGTGTRIGAVPVEGGRLYFYLVRSAPVGGPSPRDVDELRSWFPGYADTAGEILDQLEGVPALEHDLIELDSPVWGSEHVALVGDAAHAMTPNQGQGAAMAIEDACALMLALRDGRTGATERYVAARHRRVRNVQLASRRIGLIADWNSQAAVGLRELAFRSAPRVVSRGSLRALLTPGIRLAKEMTL